MAVVSTALESKVQLAVQTGVDSQGEPILKNRSYSRIKADAPDENVYQFANLIAGLQKHPLYGVERINQIKLEEV